MSRRRSLRHLVLVALGGGIVTLAVALAGATPVWLAVGPLLLVMLDTLAYSPTVRSRVRRLAHPTRSSRSTPPMDNPPYPGPLPAPTFAARHPRLVWLLYITLPVALAAAISFLSDSLWLGVIGVIVVLVVARVVLVYTEQIQAEVRVRSGPYAHYSHGGTVSTFGPVSPPSTWLTAQLAQAGDASLTVAVVGFDGSVPLGELAGAVASIARGGTRIHTQSPDEFLIVGDPRDVDRALSLFGLGWITVHPADEPPSCTLLVGEAVYPRDGRTQEELIAKARQQQRRHTP